MEQFDLYNLKKIYIPTSDSHKGQNGKLLVIGGSKLFHSASLWSLQIASRIVDMVFYSSIPTNNEIVQKSKEEFRNGIVVSRDNLISYVEEADCILIGPGMLRMQDSSRELNLDNQSIEEINKIEDEGEQTYYLTRYLLEKYPKKKWVIDAGALQIMSMSWLTLYNIENVILTPHHKEFIALFGEDGNEESIARMAKKYNCTNLLKGDVDIVCNEEKCIKINGGNAGMTKGGTGDVLAGLVASLACKNELFLSASVGSYLNKKAGEELSSTVGIYFNASDLCNMIPKVMKASM